MLHPLPAPSQPRRATRELKGRRTVFVLAIKKGNFVRCMQSGYHVQQKRRRFSPKYLERDLHYLLNR